MSHCAIVVRMPTTAGDLLTSSQVGEMLNKSARTVSRLALQGDLPIAGRMAAGNGIYLFKRQDVERYIAKQAKKQASA